MKRHSRIVERAAAHRREVLARSADHHLVNFHHIDALEFLVFAEFPQNAAIASSDNQSPLRVGDRKHGNLHQCLMVGVLVKSSKLHVPVEEKHPAKRLGVVYIDGLIGSAFVKDVLADFDGHGDLLTANREIQKLRHRNPL